jgi:hypothetical protein
LSEAKKRADAIRYSYKIVGNQLIFDNYLITDQKNKFRDQEIEITLYLPKGTLLKADDSMRNYDRTDGDYFLWHPDSSSDVFRVENNKIKCINCSDDYNDDGDDDNDYDNDDSETNVTINENGVTVEKDSVIKTKKNFKELKINKDGIIIKTE